MIWLILVLLSAFSQSTSDLFGKMSLRELDEYKFVFLRSLVATLTLLPAFFFVEVPHHDSVFWLAILASAALLSVAFVLYAKAIKSSPLSLTIPMLAFSPLLLLLTSPLMLGEFPSLLGLTGILLIVAGTYSLALRDVRKGWFAPFKSLMRERGTLLMLIVAGIYSIQANVSKIAVQHSNPLTFSLFSYALVTCFLLPMIVKKSKFSKGVSNNIRLLLLSGFFSALTMLFFAEGVQWAIVPYVIPVKRTSIIFSTLYGYFFFKEDRMGERLGGALIMILGVLLISAF